MGLDPVFLILRTLSPCEVNMAGIREFQITLRPSVVEPCVRCGPVRPFDHFAVHVARCQE